MEAKKERKKRQPNPNKIKPSGFRVEINEPFWYMIKKGGKLIQDCRIETKETLKNKSSVPAILAENGNYFKNEIDCILRIKQLSK